MLTYWGKGTFKDLYCFKRMSNTYNWIVSVSIVIFHLLKEKKDYSDVALIRKYGEDWGKENKVNSATQRLNVGKFRLRLEKGEVDKEILGNLPTKGSEIIITEDITPRKDNPKIFDINSQAAQDYQTGKIYVNPVDKQFYIVQGEGNKKTFVGIGKYY